MRLYKKKPGSRFSEVNPGPNPGSKNRSRDWDPGPNADPWSQLVNHKFIFLPIFLSTDERFLRKISTDDFRDICVLFCLAIS